MNAPTSLTMLNQARAKASVPDHIEASQAGASMSSVIRARLKASGQRFFANDNISNAFQSAEELVALEQEVEARITDVLNALVIDIENDHNTQETARRVAKMYVREVFSGRFQPAPAITTFPNVEKVNELMLIGPLTVRSACSHHLCPIIGKLWVGVLPKPGSKLIGLSKFARISDWIMSRPQIQEEAVKNLADHLERELDPAGLAVVVKANHFCMHWRGVKDNSRMTSSVMRGELHSSQALRQEFLTLVKLED
jgi:GTP cyclohydrolase I